MYRFSPPALPNPPSNLEISEVTATSVKLSWDSGNTDPIDKYTIQYKDKYHDDDYEEIPNVYQNEYTVLGLRPYTVYEFRVQSINNIGVSWPSNAKDVTTGERGMHECSVGDSARHEL